MTKEDIEWALVEAGWKLDGGFSGHLVIGEDHDLSTASRSLCSLNGTLAKKFLPDWG
jgi:hypothetical protein